ncbi:flavodoxin domain-containing protein [Streptomyces sp. H10-C2]|uniref:flavodoxin domain-containing protein n=1 Tax=unclassified Streptomyces TaxID=2593676 RepID=UPI0024BBD567|nr:MULTISPECIES: flavodoxin domain-containing protein [unclassified Streptomyces]MDJ0345839.1 flavodoxin domain-containing protein [Streptomyces sp. PH10-H1]MDJ0371195.1 flavodoxin domain-containing protein [Streptomyces sp. H10-C2]
MSERVLVAYGTKNNSTAGIAEMIGEALRGEDLSVDVLPAATVADISPYGPVILGGSLYAGRWHREAVHFARRHRKALNERPVWLFSSGPLDASASERDIPPVSGVRRIAERLDAHGHATFGGSLDENPRGRFARMMAGSGRAGDFRDPEQIRVWAVGIARELAREASTQ